MKNNITFSPAVSTEKHLHPRVGVGVYVFKDGKLLLGKRRNALGEGTWAVPGGHLEFKETVENCAKRELFEETGMIAHSVKKGGWVSNVFEEENKHYLTLFMIVEEFSGLPEVKEPEKCEYWDWFSFDELPKPLFAPLQSFLEENQF